LQENILGMAAWAQEVNASPEDRELLLEPMREILDALYERDLALAKLADESDLLLHVHGSAVSGRLPRLSVLAHLFTQTREDVTRLGKQIAGLTARAPKALDMGLVGIAGGSLFVGFSAPDDGSDDALAAATLNAVETIGQVSALVAEDAPLATIAETVPDPAARDIAVAAVRHLAPSGRIGVTEVEVLGRRLRHVSLTTATRRVARSLMSKPLVKTAERVGFVGTVRWLDLDASRFEIRNVEGNEEDVRCAYELEDDVVRELMNKRVRVAGVPELSPKGRAVRLLWVDEIEVLDDP
jgi:hypothetical protein